MNGLRNFDTQGKLSNIQGVACLYPETIQLITLANSGIKNVTDLKGKNVVMGDRGSGSWYDALDILAAYNLSESDVKPSAVKLSQAAEMMKNGQVDAAFWTGGAPTGAITDLAATNDIYIVPISGAPRDRSDEPVIVLHGVHAASQHLQKHNDPDRDGHRYVNAGRQQRYPDGRRLQPV